MSAAMRRPATEPSGERDGLREAGDGYEVRVWQPHMPSGVVVLKGHPQLGGRYCLTDGGDWPCSVVRAALDTGDPARRQWPRWECSACTRNANQCDRLPVGCCPDCNHDKDATEPSGERDGLLREAEAFNNASGYVCPEHAAIGFAYTVFGCRRCYDALDTGKPALTENRTEGPR